MTIGMFIYRGEEQECEMFLFSSMNTALVAASVAVEGGAFVSFSIIKGEVA